MRFEYTQLVLETMRLECSQGMENGWICLEMMRLKCLQTIRKKERKKKQNEDEMMRLGCS